MAILVRTSQFQKRIKRIHVDKAHSIHTASLSRNGIPAFQSAWGMLDKLKALLPKSIPWQAMSATFPLHILKTVESKILRPNYVSICILSNRPNTTYATHCVVTSLEKLENYDCFLSNPFVFAAQPRVLIFFDDRKLTSLVSKHLNNQLPVPLRGRGIVQHYHSGMSEDYLQKVHAAFTEKDCSCKILCATSGESVVSGC
jgi:superfamily II DNA helicase RecQ